MYKLTKVISMMLWVCGTVGIVEGQTPELIEFTGFNIPVSAIKEKITSSTGPNALGIMKEKPSQLPEVLEFHPLEQQLVEEFNNTVEPVRV